MSKKGDALNVLVYDLTDPDIKLSDWSSKTVPLPEGMSVKDLIFRFTPQSKQGAGATALSKGVIALSRLDIKGKWPTFMEIPALAAEKSAYENAYVKVRDEILAEKFNLKSLLEMDRTLDALKSKVKEAVPAERDYRAQALKFVDDLKDSTRMFDAGTVDYAKDILTDTKNGDATTVAELVSFMLKYRLQFATAERSSTARELYPKLYEALRQQANELGIKPPEVPVIEQGPSFFNGKDLTGWRGLPAVWAIRDGALVGTSRPGALKVNTCLVSDQEYGDFELRCQVKLSVNPAANSGIQFRSVLVDMNAFSVRGPQCDFGEGVAWGSLYGEGTGGMMQEADKAVVAKALKVGEFNELILRCVGQRVTIRLNGRVTFDNEFPGIPTRGVIGWQFHKKGGEVVFKNIEFKALPSK